MNMRGMFNDKHIGKVVMLYVERTIVKVKPDGMVRVPYESIRSVDLLRTAPRSDVEPTFVGYLMAL